MDTSPVSQEKCDRTTADELESRATIYKFLASFAVTPIPVPGDTYCKKLAPVLQAFAETIDCEVSDNNTAVKQAIEHALQNIWENAEIEQRELSIERTKYIRGVSLSNRVKPPYESLYLCTCDSVDKIASVSGAYKSAGYQLQPEGNDRADSLSAELAFMAQLLTTQKNALTEQDEPTARKTQCQASSFLIDHIGAWAPAFCVQAANLTNSSSLRAILLFARSFIEGERKEASEEVKRKSVSLAS